MDKLTDRKQIRFLTYLCSLVYFISYVSRVNLAAVLVAVVDTGFAAKETAAMALTVCAVTYGLGQLISGYLGDRCRPQNVILTGFLITAAVNISVGFLSDGRLLIPLWAVNGFAQALMWPPLVAIMSGFFHPEDYRLACVRVSWGSSFGTIAVYLISPFVIRLLGLRYVFLLSGAAALVMLVAWKILFERFFSQNPQSGKKETVSASSSSKKLDKMAYLVLCSVLICVLLEGFLRDGVSNWTPSYISEVFHLSSSTSILSGVVLPLFTIFSLQITSVIYRRALKNEMTCAAVIFISGAVSAFFLSMVTGRSAVLSLGCLALLVGSMHGVQMLLTSMVPIYFSEYGRVSLISGIINAGVYMGCAISGYGTAAFSEAYGWTRTILLWAGAALAGTVLCFLLRRFWEKFTNKTE